MSARCGADAWAVPNPGAAAVPNGRAAAVVKNDVHLDNSLDSGVDGMRDSPNNSAEDIPDYIVDVSAATTYLRGKFLGKGGFARVHEMIDSNTNVIFAGKIIPKSRITKPHHRDKIAREIDVHRSLRHRHVVGFHGCFEDDDNVYIVLENCPRKSLVHVLKHRVTLTEPEVRYFLWQLVEGVQYIHSQKIIHRDLKLGNMFLTADMVMKIGDFGLATRSDPTSPSKATICGTPNYIAPEVLGKMGHGFQADVWAMGCIMYAMLVGQPPFETSTLKETYYRISTNKYVVPPSLSSSAKNLIARLLHPQPNMRPTVNQILNDEFFAAGYWPEVLPTSACTQPPKFPSTCVMIARRTEQMDASTSRPDEGSGIVTSMSTLNIAPDSSHSTVSAGVEAGSSKPHFGKRTVTMRRDTGVVAMDTSNESKLSRSQSLKDNLQCISVSPSSCLQMAAAAAATMTTPPAVTSSASKYMERYRQGIRLLGAKSSDKLSSGSSSSGSAGTSPSSSNPASNNVSTSASTGNSNNSCSSPCHNNNNQNNGASADPGPVTGNSCNVPMFNHVAVATMRMQEAVMHCLRVMPVDARCNPSPRPGPQPLFISKWIDYSNKYGFGFQLSDKSVGVLFNDNTRIACSGDKRRIEFWNNEGGLSIFNQADVPPALAERYTLLRYFSKYMDENLTDGVCQNVGGAQGGQHQQQRGNKADSSCPTSPSSSSSINVTTVAAGAAARASTIPHMRRWMRSSTAIIMHLSDGTVQVNFFKDHTKIVISVADGGFGMGGDQRVPQKSVVLVTFINSQRNSHTYDVTSLALRGCEQTFRERLAFAAQAFEDLVPVQEKQV